MNTTGRGDWGRFGVAFIGLTFAVGSCASMSAPRAAVPDLRGNANVSTPEPRLLVTGPVDLLHVNVDRAAGATFLRVPGYAGAVPDCRRGAPIDLDGESDLYVQKDESVCVAVLRDARVSWDARAASFGILVIGTQQASVPYQPVVEGFGLTPPPVRA